MGSAVLTLPLLKAVEDTMNRGASVTILSTHITRSVFESVELRKSVQQLSLFSWRDVLKLILSYKKYDLIIDTEEYFQISALIALWCGKRSIGFDTKFPRKYGYTDSVKYDDKKHVVQVFLDLLRPIHTEKISAQNLVPLNFWSEDARIVDEFLKNHTNQDFIVGFHLGWSTTAEDRFWPIERFTQVIRTLTNKYPNFLCIITGTNREYEGYKRVIDIIDEKHRVLFFNGSKFCLSTFACLLKRCHIFVANDSGPMHVSAAMGTYTIGLFWPNLPQRFWPYPLEQNKVFYHGDWIASINVHDGKFKPDIHEWIKAITTEEVLEAIETQYERHT